VLWTCSGVRLTTDGAIRDKETCLLTGHTSVLVAGTYIGRPAVFVPGYGLVAWASDFDGLAATVDSTRLVDNHDGTFTVYVIAFYN
jgi:hypothetical protein